MTPEARLSVSHIHVPGGGVNPQNHLLNALVAAFPLGQRYEYVTVIELLLRADRGLGAEPNDQQPRNDSLHSHHSTSG